MRKLFGIFLILALLPAVLAVNLDIEKISSDEVLILGLADAVNFDVQITNNGFSDNFEFYTFFGSKMIPEKTVRIEKDETKNMTISFFPRDDIELKGKVGIEYFIQGGDRSSQKEKVSVNILELGEAFKIGSSSVNPESRELTIFIQNKVNFDFKDLEVDFTSPFFDLSKTIHLKPYGKQEFVIDLDKEAFNKLMAGFYTFYANVEIDNVRSSLKGIVEFEEKDLLKTSTDTYGFIITTEIIKKVNEGNTVEESVITVNKNIFSRLFTTFSPEPEQVDRDGTKVKYSWTQKINPGESIEVKVKTNWLLPFLAIFLAFVLVYVFRKYANQTLLIRKKVAFVRAKGGEFALKVTVIAEAKEYIEKIRIVERLPPLVKMYERFGGELPDKISRDKQRLEWEYSHLEAGERRVMSYIVYSKVGVLGKFALPGTVGFFEKEGKQKQTTSNKAFFLAEQKEQKQQKQIE